MLTLGGAAQKVSGGPGMLFEVNSKRCHQRLRTAVANEQTLKDISVKSNN